MRTLLPFLSRMFFEPWFPEAKNDRVHAGVMGQNMIQWEP